MSATAPIGWKRVEAAVSLTLSPPLGFTIERDLDESGTYFGDPILGGTLGWHAGNLHYSVGSMLNVPVGYWEQGNLDNIGFNRWAIDVNAAFTWLDPAVGIEISSAAGFTFNFENPDTDYKTGTEFHVELAVLRHFTKTFSMGVTGYHYQQVSGDSGSGALLGDYKGRISAIGPVAAYSFAIGQTPVSTELKWMHEFGAENRPEGDAGLLTVTIPLGAAPVPASGEAGR